jgi:hypothetical protein
MQFPTMMHEMSNAFTQMERISGQNAEVALPKALATRNYYIDGRGRSPKDAKREESRADMKEKEESERGELARAKTNCPCLRGKASAHREMCMCTYMHIYMSSCLMFDL